MHGGVTNTPKRLCGCFEGEIQQKYIHWEYVEAVEPSESPCTASQTTEFGASVHH